MATTSQGVAELDQQLPGVVDTVGACWRCSIISTISNIITTITTTISTSISITTITTITTDSQSSDINTFVGLVESEGGIFFNGISTLRECVREVDVYSAPNQDGFDDVRGV